MAIKSRDIYKEKLINSTDFFMGVGMMGKFFSAEKLEKYLVFAKDQSENKGFSMEIMSHAGFI